MKRKTDSTLCLNDGKQKEVLYRLVSKAENGVEWYELWRDNEEGNLDENGQPLSYMKTMYVPKAASEDFTSHIQAHKIGDTMTETEMKAQAYDILTGVSE